MRFLERPIRFIDPLYTGTPSYVAATLPALMNSVKMIHTIARYYNTTERMTNLFTKITNQMITNCKESILDGEEKDEREKEGMAALHWWFRCSTRWHSGS